MGTNMTSPLLQKTIHAMENTGLIENRPRKGEDSFFVLVDSRALFQKKTPLMMHIVAILKMLTPAANKLCVGIHAL